MRAVVGAEIDGVLRLVIGLYNGNIAPAEPFLLAQPEISAVPGNPVGLVVFGRVRREDKLVSGAVGPSQAAPRMKAKVLRAVEEGDLAGDIYLVIALGQGFRDVEERQELVNYRRV